MQAILISLAVFVCTAFGLEVKLISPIAGNYWHTGQTVTVQWDTRQVNTSLIHQIDLDLVQGNPDNVVENISFGVPVDGHYAEWVVPKRLPAGSDYMVRVTSAEDAGFRMVGPKFSVGRNGTKGNGSKNPAAGRPKPVETYVPIVLYLGLLSLFFVL